MQEPIIKNFIQKENEVKLTLVFPSDAQYFQGHFSEFPILPAVAQIHFAVFFSKKYLNINPNISSLKKLRFTNIIEPEMQVFLSLNYNPEKQVVSFNYSSEKLSHSEGKIELV